MGTYFLDCVRNKYKLLPQGSDDAFAATLHAKSGYPMEELKKILFFINNLEETTISDQQLFTFYRQLETFYQTT